MEPINYRDALRRRWPVVVAVALVGTIIGGLIPVHVSYPPPHTQYEASALIGVTPGSTTGPAPIGGQITTKQIIFFANNQQIIANAAKAAGIKGKAAALEKDITLTSKKKKKSLTPAGTLRISVKQPSAKRSAKLTTAFVQALSQYIDQYLAAQHQKALRSAQQKVSSLSAKLQNLESELAAAEPSPATTTTTTTTTTLPTTTTTLPRAATAATANAVGKNSSGANGGAVRAVLTASKTNPSVGLLQTQISVTNAAYQSALSTVNNLEQNPPPKSGIVTLQPALASQAKKIPVHTSVLDHHSIRALLGLVGGGLLGAAVILLLDALNKTLRTVGRTQETLGYPVLAEIPKADTSRAFSLRRRPQVSPRPSPVFATLSEPGSAIAEAYRMLRTAVLLEPVIGPGSRSGSASNGDRSTVDPSDAPRASDSAVASPSSEQGRRQVVLVVSAGVEPTRALVVTNLAAAFAEAGDSALVVTTADLRQRDQMQNTVVMGSAGSDISPDTVAASTRPTDMVGVRSLALSRMIDGPGQLGVTVAAILAAAREVADVVIVDAPLLAVHDAEALVPAVDVVVVVVEAWWTKVDQATRSGIFLRRIAAPVLGAVLTEVRLGPKDLRRLAERTAQPDAEEEERVMEAARMSRHGRRRRRQAPWAEV